MGRRYSAIALVLAMAVAQPAGAGGPGQMWSGDQRRKIERDFPALWLASDNPKGLYMFGQVTTVGQVASKTDKGSRYQGSVNWEFPGALRLFRDGRHGGGMLAWNALGTFITSSSQDNWLHQRMGAESETYDDLVKGEFMVRELWYAHGVARDTFLLGGKLEPGNIWDMNALANEPAEDFMAGSLNDSQAVRFPDAGLGVNVQTRLNHSLSLAAGIQQNNADERTFNLNELEVSQLFYGAELHWQVDPGGRKPGNYRLLAFYSREGSRRDQGLSLSADQQFGIIGFFARLGTTHNDINPVSRFVSAGLSMGLPKHSPRNRLGLGWSWSKVDDGRNETLVEAFYRLELNRFVAITPDLQLVSNPAYARNSSNIWVANLRLQASF